MPYRFSNNDPSVVLARSAIGGLWLGVIVGAFLLSGADTYNFAGIVRGIAGVGLIVGSIILAVYLWKRI
ncbi:MAG: hypothetical protein AB7I42_30200 [Bradyrhizobium sp.]|uniref:hypothetical protein n=1 Tax=Bradyrhizobium sp. TaxID=376 RepID=UPI003D0E8EB7